MNASIDVTNVRLETERLVIRPWEQKDLADLYAYASVSGVGEMAGWNHHKSLEESQAVLNMFMDGKKTFALELRESRTVIGSLGIELMHPDPVTGEKYGREIGYVLGKAHWGRGLMPEAVSAVITYCFDVLKYDYLTCGHFAQNMQSKRVIEKCGFDFFGFSEFQTHFGTTENCANYILYNPNK